MRLIEFLIEGQDPDPYAEGMRGFVKHEPCQYEEGTKEYDEWHLGYGDAESDRRGGSGKGLEESEANYVAMSAYNANYAKAMDKLEMVKLTLMKHRDAYLSTDRRNWGYPGDLERLNTDLDGINDWMRKSSANGRKYNK